MSRSPFVCVTFLTVVPADVVDPNRDGFISLQEYMAFMISKETENVQSSEEIEHAFRAITNGERPYVLKEELYTVSGLAAGRRRAGSAMRRRAAAGDEDRVPVLNLLQFPGLVRGSLRFCLRFVRSRDLAARFDLYKG